jgi:hypothetical protein
MAAGGGSAADAKVSAQVIAAVAAPREAVKQLRAELKAAYAEQDKLIARGQALDIGAQNKKIAHISGLLDSSLALDKKNREVERRSKQALAIGKATTALFAAQSIGNLLRGDVSARDFVSIASLAATHEKAIARAFGKRVSSFVSKFGAVGPFIALAVDEVAGGFAKAASMDKGFEAMGRMVQGGKVDASTYAAVGESFQSWNLLRGAYFDPTEMGKSVATAAAKVTSRNATEMRSAISAARKSQLDTIGFNVGDFQRSTPDSILNKYRQEIARELDQGSILDDDAKSRIFQRVLNGLIKNDRVRQAFADAIQEETQKQAEKTGPQQKMHTQLFWENEQKVREQIDARRNFIPAKIEY